MGTYRNAAIVTAPKGKKPLTLSRLMTLCGRKRAKRYHFLNLQNGTFVVSCIKGRFGVGWITAADLEMRPCIITADQPRSPLPEQYESAEFGGIYAISFLGEAMPDWKSLFPEIATVVSAAAD